MAKTLAGVMMQIHRHNQRERQRAQRRAARATNSGTHAPRQLTQKQIQADQRAARNRAYNEGQRQHQDRLAAITGEARATMHQHPAVDWHALANPPRPSEPARPTGRTDAAAAALGAFKPSMWDVISGKRHEKRTQLEAQLTAARQADQQEANRLRQAYEHHVRAVGSERRLARGIMARDRKFLLAGLERAIDELECTAQFGGNVSASLQGRRVLVEGHLDLESMVPLTLRKPLKRGGGKDEPVSKKVRAEAQQMRLAGFALQASRLMLASFPGLPFTIRASTPIQDSAGGLVRKCVLEASPGPKSIEAAAGFGDPLMILECMGASFKFLKTRPFEEIKPSQRPPT